MTLVAALGPFVGCLMAQGPVPAGDEFQVNTYTTGGQLYGAVASDPAGAFVVVWQGADEDGDGDGIFGQRYDDDGSPLGAEFQANAYTTDEQRWPAISTDDSGNFVVVWASYFQDGSVNSIFGQRYDPSGAPQGGEFPVNSYTPSTQIAPSVSHAGSGDFVVTWTGAGPGDDVGVFGRRFDGLGNPLGSDFLVNTYTTGHQLFGGVSSDAAGNFVVVWSNYGFPDTFGILGQRFDATGSPVGGEFQVNTSTVTPRTPAVSMNDGGRFVVVWEEPLPAGKRSVFGRRYESDGSPLGGPFQVNSYSTSEQRVPSVATDDDGSFVVLWTDTLRDGDAWGVFGQRFDPLGSPLGSDFQVHQYTTNYQTTRVLGPPLATDGSGDFVVAWSSWGQDGDGYGVFARRFIASPIGGTSTGVLVRHVTCRNLTTGQQVAATSASPDWDCSALGLSASPGDRASMIVVGRAASVPPVAGTVTGFAIPPNLRVRCENITTAAAVQFVTGLPSWDCTAQGLVASPNDRLRLRLVGTVQ